MSFRETLESYGDTIGAVDSLLAIVGVAVFIVVWIWRRGRNVAGPNKLAPPSKAILIGDLKTNRDIIGRDARVEEVRRGLVHNGKAAIVKGQGGIGKSSLAREYARQHAGDYDGVIWVDAETETGLIAGLKRLAPHIEVAGLDQMAEPDQARTLLEALPTKGRWLVIYDNVEQEAKLKGWWPPEGVHLVITSRSMDWSGGVSEVAPETLRCENAEDDGPQLLMSEAQQFDDPEGAVALARELDGLPLALVVAGALAREGQSFAEVQGEIEAVLAKVETLDHGGSVLAVIEVSYNRLGVDARRVVDLFAWFAPEGLSAQLLTDVPGSERLAVYLEPIDEDLRALCGDPGRVTAALRELASRSLITRGDGGYDMHRLTADALRALQGAQMVEAAAVLGAAVLAAGYPGGAESPEHSGSWSKCRRLTPHVLAYRRAVAQDAPVIPAVHYLYNQASIYLQEQAQFDPALDLARESLRLTQARLGSEHSDIAQGHSTLGVAYLYAGQAALAVKELRVAVKLCETHDHGVAALATWLGNLSSALWQLGWETGERALLEEALAVNMRALGLRRDAFGAVHEDVALSLSNIATSHAALGDLAAAINWARWALEVRREVLTPQDVRMGYPLSNLGSYLLRVGQAREAVGLLEEALSVWRAHLAVDHPHLRDTASWLVSARITLGQGDAARALADEFGLDWEAHKQAAAQYPAPID